MISRLIRKVLHALVPREAVTASEEGAVRSTSGMLALRAALVFLTFPTSLLLTRMLGVTEYGVYAYAISWIQLLVLPASLGLDRLVVREVASGLRARTWDTAKGILRWSNWAVSGASVLTTAILALCGITFFDLEVRPALFVALPLLMLTALTRLRQGAMRGLSHVLLGQLPELVIQPVMFIVLLGVLFVSSSAGLSPTAIQATLLHVASAGFAFLVGAWLLRSKMPSQIRTAKAKYEHRAWILGTISLVVIGISGSVNMRIDVVMLGAIHGPTAVGIYRIATKAADLILVVLVAANAALAPLVAGMYRAARLEEIQRLITRASRAILAVSLVIALLLVFFGDYVLQLFGAEFVSGFSSLRILSAARLTNAAFGPVGMLLVMMNREKEAAFGFGISLLANILLNGLLIPAYSLQGAALAALVTSILRNGFLAWLVVSRTGIVSTAFKLTRRTRGQV